MFQLGPLDGPYENSDPIFKTLDDAKGSIDRPNPADDTKAIWDMDDGSRLVALYWQGNWYDVS